jgi:hypothetical protein
MAWCLAADAVYLLRGGPMADLFDDLDDDIRGADRLPCGCPREVNPEDECNGWHWAREEWDTRG